MRRRATATSRPLQRSRASGNQVEGVMLSACRFSGGAKHLACVAKVLRRRGNQTLHPPLGATAPRHLYSSFALIPSTQSGAPTFHAQTYIPTQPAQAIQEARISHAHEDPGRPESSFPPSRQGTQAGLSEARIPRIIVGADTLVRVPPCRTAIGKTSRERRSPQGRL